MAKDKRSRNPFYFLLVPVGVAFVVTSFSFGMMAYQQSRPGALPLDGKVGLMPLLDRHGLKILGVEVALIAVFSCGAIATDELWQRRDAKKEETSGQAADATAKRTSSNSNSKTDEPTGSPSEPVEI